MAGGGVDAIAVGTVAAGGMLVWTGLKGASTLEVVQALIRGEQPTGDTAYPITTPIGTGNNTATAGAGVTGDASGMVALARAQIGYREGGGNSNKYSHELGRPSEAWCADFIDWLAYKTGNRGVIPWTASAPGMAQAFGSRFHSGSSGIQPGDIVFYTGASNGWHRIGHVGIAVTANASGSWQSVEGNYGDKVALNTRHSCQGYAKPGYTGATNVTASGARVSPRAEGH